MKKCIILVFVIILLLSLGLNIYAVAYPWARDRGARETANAMNAAILRQYQRNGRLQMTINGKNVVFVPLSADRPPDVNVPDEIIE